MEENIFEKKSKILLNFVQERLTRHKKRDGSYTTTGVTEGEDFTYRNNTPSEKEKSNAFFGLISKGEETSGPYSDLSLVIFPAKKSEKADGKKKGASEKAEGKKEDSTEKEEENEAENLWMVALVVGTNGLDKDYQLAALPGTRRSFLKLENAINAKKKEGNEVKGFVKSDFLDFKSNPSCLGKIIKNKYLKGTVDKYKSYILACHLFDVKEFEALNIDFKDKNATGYKETILFGYLECYALMRGWKKPEHCESTLLEYKGNASATIDEITALLEKRKYVVLQGAPGTAKTYSAKMVAKKMRCKKEDIFFKQFHAETTYADFVSGIFPSTSGGTLSYTRKDGVLVEAIQHAMGTKNKVVLIIDEINRANLSNVLGEAFYLFEPNMSDSGIEVHLSENLKDLSKLPDNLYVIATMNTADRSLAVVDFALRRRFAWITMRPEIIKKPGNKLVFCEKEFNDIAAIFEKHATDEELNLQPGQGYFLVKNNKTWAEEMKERLKYEIMPLIKEYFNEGIMLSAKDDFVSYFRDTIKEDMYK